MSQQVSRRQFYKAALAALGGGTIATLLCQAGGGGIGTEIDPLAVLKSPTLQQTVQPLVDIQPLRMVSYDEITATPAFEIADPALLRGFSFYPGTTNPSTIMALARQ